MDPMPVTRAAYYDARWGGGPCRRAEEGKIGARRWCRRGKPRLGGELAALGLVAATRIIQIVDARDGSSRPSTATDASVRPSSPSPDVLASRPSPSFYDQAVSGADAIETRLRCLARAHRCL